MLHIPDGFFIVLEGIDGCGKTTLTTQLGHILSKKDIPVVTTREPGQTALGMKIRQLVQERDVSMCPKSEYLLFATNRAQHYDEFIAPHLAQGNVVISDRFFDSSLVYQGYARGLERNILQTINTWVTAGRAPDLVVYVRISPGEAAERVKKRGKQLSAYEKEHETFLAKVFQGYEELVAPRSDVLVVDGCIEPVQLAQATADYIYTLLCPETRITPCRQ